MANPTTTSWHDWRKNTASTCTTAMTNKGIASSYQTALPYTPSSPQPPTKPSTPTRRSSNCKKNTYTPSRHGCVTPSGKSTYPTTSSKLLPPTSAHGRRTRVKANGTSSKSTNGSRATTPNRRTAKTKSNASSKPTASMATARVHRATRVVCKLATASP